MKLIIDSGGSKADYALLSDDGTSRVYTEKGISLSEPSISLPSYLDCKSISSIHIYIAQKYNEEIVSPLREYINNTFTYAAEVNIYSDLLAAAHALCQGKKGIACILGTGSNSCVFDGSQIIHHITPLGYIVGDEGSGTEIGKAILKAFYYREMPSDLYETYTAYLNPDRQEILDKLYVNGTARTTLAEIAQLPLKVPHEFTNTILRKEFNHFIKRRILPYGEYLELPIHFVGSIAYFYQEILTECLTAYNLTPGQILQSPISGLINYHK